MLGTTERPSLLVDVEKEHGPNHFDFYVVNGNWNGTFTNGHVTVWHPPTGSWSDLDITEILTDNQDRLRGKYRDVFDNFDNPDYVAPKPDKYIPQDWDDDIPF